MSKDPKTVNQRKIRVNSVKANNVTPISIAEMNGMMTKLTEKKNLKMKNKAVFHP